MIIALMLIITIPIIVAIVWFILESKASDERYDRDIEQIYRRKRKK